MDACTDEVDDQAAVGGAPGGVTEETLAIRGVVEGDGWDTGGLEDEVASVGVGAAKTEDGMEAPGAVVDGPGVSRSARAMEEARDEDDYGQRRRRRLHQLLIRRWCGTEGCSQSWPV